MFENESLDIEIEKIKDSLQAEVVFGDGLLTNRVTGIYASDLMSDVLAYGKSGSILLTGLNTIQAVISSYMAEFKAIVFLRGKKPAADIKKFAEEKGLVILATHLDLFEACARIAYLHKNLSIIPEAVTPVKKEENITTHSFNIEGQDFASAGMVSSQIKAILKTIGYNHELVRRIAISTYEGEMNVYMHAIRGRATLQAGDTEIVVIISDVGKGIPDIELAMQPGYTTSTEEQRAKGFGSGMGLANIKKNSDVMNVTSEVGKGTLVELHFFVT